ncbi:MAG: prolipoprotein diacylglyceryl transferase [Finegoldia sp.]|nr:prolipoprotein diacylglyceryl transferase [Finegoldia sp.]
MDRVAFSIFGIDIMWYGILIATGIICGYMVAKNLAKKDGVEEDLILDFLLIALPLAIVGARLYYVIFEWDYYSKNPIEIFNIRGGGLAIYGGLIAAIITAFVFTKKKNIKFLRLADICLPGVSIGQAIGRWGNFINQEAYGTATNLPWAITIEGQKVHPTFLYESIGDFLIFLILFNMFSKNHDYYGKTTAWYCILYGILRFFVEGFRTDSLYIGSFRVSQLVSLAIIFIGTLIILNNKNAKTSTI